MSNRKVRATVTATVATTVAASVGALALSAAPAAGGELGENSLVNVLDADGNAFDKKWGDFDIVHRAATTVLEAKPDSAVGVLADGSTAATAFLPTDRAFRKLVRQVSGADAPLQRERAVFNAIAESFDVDTIEAVLLYHVVPGATITYGQAKKADGAELDTAAGGALTVKVRGNTVRLVDADTDDRNARVIYQLRNLNKGNKQIAHGIDRVLRPLDLP